MNTGSEIFFQTKARQARSDSASQMQGYPDDVLDHPNMSVAEKRALLASWASDARALAGVPILRQLDDGSIVRVDEILRALKALDAQQPDEKGRSRTPWGSPYNRRHLRKLSPWFRRRRRDDDDDPPPCPALGAIPPRIGTGGATACPEPALA